MFNAKTKAMGFLGKNPVRIKIVVDTTIFKKVAHFNYFGVKSGIGKIKILKEKLIP